MRIVLMFSVSLLGLKVFSGYEIGCACGIFILKYSKLSDIYALWLLSAVGQEFET